MNRSAPPSLWSNPRLTLVRRVIFQVHLWSGLLLGAYLLIVGLTGSAIVFRGEIEDAVHSQLTRVAPGEKAVPVQPLLDAAGQVEPGARFHTINLPTHPRQSLSIWGHDAQGRSFHVYFDPWTGAHLGRDLAGDNRTEWLYELHTNLLGGSTGELINGVAAVLTCALLASGLVVWWPGAGRILSEGLSYRRRASWKRRSFDLHRLVGFWSAALLLLVTVTGVWFVFPAPFRWLAETVTRSSSHEGSPASDPAHRHLTRISLDEALRSASSVLPEAAPNWIRLPSDPADVFSIRKRLPWEWRLDGMNYIHIDPQTGAVVRADLHSSATPAQRLLRTFFPLHAGTFGGLTTRVLWVLLGLTPGVLMISGTLMWWNRVVRPALRQRQFAKTNAVPYPRSPLTAANGQPQSGNERN